MGGRASSKVCCAAIAAGVMACGGGGARGSGSASDESGDTLTTTVGTTASTSDGSGEGTGTAGTTASTTASTTVADSSSGNATEGTKFDLGVGPDVGRPACGDGKGGGVEFSYIWVCNSSEGTISKINTQTMEEEGRYYTRADHLGSPSRTSVNLSGDVAVANRLGGITKLYARAEDCVESNGMPGLQTSSGKNDVLAWGADECVAWHTPFAYSTQRPVAWAPGTLDESTCTYQNEKLWTAGGQNDVIDSLEVVRINGDDGSIDATIPMPDVPIGYFGAYGGAVNQAGDFWFVIYDTYNVPETYMVRVDAGDLSYELVAVPAEICPYGFTVDADGRPWIGSFCNSSARYTPGTGTWDLVGALGYGIQQDQMGRMWLADYQLPGVREIDAESLALGVAIPLAASSPKGVSIDFEGNVWVVDMFQSAFRIDPDTMTIDEYNQLNGPYTYSDMTGWGLNNVAFPPG
ncbi:MAG: hypothetical protein U0168_07965 [Nannocystaceae bacterium]